MHNACGLQVLRRLAITLSILFVFCLFGSDVQGQAIQGKFVIASWWDPDFTGIAAIDEMRLSLFRNAHFNTLTGLNARSSNGMLEEAPAHYPGVRYKLERIAKVGGLRLMLLDWLFWTNMKSDISRTVGSVVAQYGGLPLSLANLVAGYNTWDEPQPGDQLARAKSWILEFNKKDPRRIVWANLAPYNQGTFPKWSNYVDYVRSYLADNSTSVASFDYYPFLGNGKWRNYCHDPKDPPYYFRNLDLFAVETRVKGAIFWAFPLSSQHVDYSPISRVNLQFTAFAPIVNGAKGLVYYTYQWCREDATMRSSIVDTNGDTTEIYSWAKAINQQVESLGPLLMSFAWQGTYHENSSDTGYAGCSTEPGLSMLPSNHTFIRSFSSSNKSSMIGEFKTGSAPYLLVFNKDRSSSRDVTLTLKKSVPVWECNKITGLWTRKSAPTESITIQAIQPADVRVLRLAD